jgi:hypothetical protein
MRTKKAALGKYWGAGMEWVGKRNGMQAEMLFSFAI